VTAHPVRHCHCLPACTRRPISPPAAADCTATCLPHHGSPATFLPYANTLPSRLPAPACRERPAACTSARCTACRTTCIPACTLPRTTCLPGTACLHLPPHPCTASGCACTTVLPPHRATACCLPCTRRVLPPPPHAPDGSRHRLHTPPHLPACTCTRLHLPPACHHLRTACLPGLPACRHTLPDTALPAPATCSAGLLRTTTPPPAHTALPGLPHHLHPALLTCLHHPTTCTGSTAPTLTTHRTPCLYHYHLPTPHTYLPTHLVLVGTFCWVPYCHHCLPPRTCLHHHTPALPAAPPHPATPLLHTCRWDRTLPRPGTHLLTPPGTHLHACTHCTHRMPAYLHLTYLLLPATNTPHLTLASPACTDLPALVNHGSAPTVTCRRSTCLHLHCYHLPACTTCLWFLGSACLPTHSAYTCTYAYAHHTCLRPCCTLPPHAARTLRTTPGPPHCTTATCAGVYRRTAVLPAPACLPPACTLPAAADVRTTACRLPAVRLHTCYTPIPLVLLHYVSPTRFAPATACRHRMPPHTPARTLRTCCCCLPRTAACWFCHTTRLAPPPACLLPACRHTLLHWVLCLCLPATACTATTAQLLTPAPPPPPACRGASACVLLRDALPACRATPPARAPRCLRVPACLPGPRLRIPAAPPAALAHTLHATHLRRRFCLLPRFTTHRATHAAACATACYAYACCTAAPPACGSHALHHTCLPTTTTMPALLPARTYYHWMLCPMPPCCGPTCTSLTSPCAHGCLYPRVHLLTPLPAPPALPPARSLPALLMTLLLHRRHQVHLLLLHHHRHTCTSALPPPPTALRAAACTTCGSPCTLLPLPVLPPIRALHAPPRIGMGYRCLHTLLRFAPHHPPTAAPPATAHCPVAPALLPATHLAAPATALHSSPATAHRSAYLHTLPAACLHAPTPACTACYHGSPPPRYHRCLHTAAGHHHHRLPAACLP